MRPVPAGLDRAGLGAAGNRFCSGKCPAHQLALLVRQKDECLGLGEQCLIGEEVQVRLLVGGGDEDGLLRHFRHAGNGEVV